MGNVGEGYDVVGNVGGRVRGRMGCSGKCGGKSMG